MTFDLLSWVFSIAIAAVVATQSMATNPPIPAIAFGVVLHLIIVGVHGWRGYFQKNRKVAFVAFYVVPALVSIGFFAWMFV